MTIPLSIQRAYSRACELNHSRSAAPTSKRGHCDEHIPNKRRRLHLRSGALSGHLGTYDRALLSLPWLSVKLRVCLCTECSVRGGSGRVDFRRGRVNHGSDAKWHRPRHHAVHKMQNCSLEQLQHGGNTRTYPVHSRRHTGRSGPASTGCSYLLGIKTAVGHSAKGRPKRRSVL